MDRVASRIMRLWNARKDDEDFVLLLFSINGGKSYCGLAKLTGPWIPGISIEGWVGEEGGSRVMGYDSFHTYPSHLLISTQCDPNRMGVCEGRSLHALRTH